MADQKVVWGLAAAALGLATRDILVVDERPDPEIATYTPTGRALGAGARRAAEREARERKAREALYANTTTRSHRNKSGE